VAWAVSSWLAHLTITGEGRNRDQDRGPRQVVAYVIVPEEEAITLTVHRTTVPRRGGTGTSSIMAHLGVTPGRGAPPWITADDLRRITLRQGTTEPVSGSGVTGEDLQVGVPRANVAGRSCPIGWWLNGSESAWRTASAGRLSDRGGRDVGVGSPSGTRRRGFHSATGHQPNPLNEAAVWTGHAVMTIVGPLSATWFARTQWRRPC
jgi:hypothetical protein